MGAVIFAVDPAVAASRQVSKAEPDSDGAVARTIAAIPAAEAEADRLSIPTAFDGRLPEGFRSRPPEISSRVRTNFASFDLANCAGGQPRV
jgi:hypothetical protein